MFVVTRFSAVVAQPVKKATVATPMQTAIIALCLRPQGATTKDLYAYTGTTSTKGVPWRDNVAVCAKRFGYVFSISIDSARQVHYHFATPESGQVATLAHLATAPAPANGAVAQAAALASIPAPAPVAYAFANLQPHWTPWHAVKPVPNFVLDSAGYRFA